MSESDVPVQYFKTANFLLDCGTTLPELVVAYQTYGKRFDGDGRKKRAVLVSTCFGEVVSTWPGEECQKGLIGVQASGRK
jgi:homoserine acetyltransferase